MNPKIEQAFNAHINAELYSSYLYLAMSNCFVSKALEGMGVEEAVVGLSLYTGKLNHNAIWR